MNSKRPAPDTPANPTAFPKSVRAALTETRNAFGAMPAQVEELEVLRPRLAEMRQANLEHHATLLAEAARQGVQVTGLGELFAAPYFALTRHPMWLELAEPIPGPTTEFMQNCARQYDMVLVVPVYERTESGKRFNTAVVIDRDGSFCGSYRKTHIPVGENETGVFDEAFYYERSDGQMENPRALGTNPFFPVFRTTVGQIGVATCYDRHFPGVTASLAAAGAQLIFSPAVTFGDKSRSCWEHEFATDAVRHRVFIGGSNRRGAEAPWGIEYFGRSHFRGPEGELPNHSSHAELIVSDLELASLNNPDPAGWNLERDRRPDIYSDV